MQGYSTTGRAAGPGPCATFYVSRPPAYVLTGVSSAERRPPLGASRECPRRGARLSTKRPDGTTVEGLSRGGLEAAMRRRVGTSLYAGLLFTVLGVLAWGSGQPFILPSLGPTAFVLAFDRRSNRTRSCRVIGSHLIGGVAGPAAWVAVAAGVSITATPPSFSAEGFRLAASATVSIVATSRAMIATDTVHPPPCATTFIVSLGLLSTALRVGIIVGSVTILVAFHSCALLVFRRLVGDAHPFYRDREMD